MVIKEETIRKIAQAGLMILYSAGFLWLYSGSGDTYIKRYCLIFATCLGLIGFSISIGISLWSLITDKEEEQKEENVIRWVKD